MIIVNASVQKFINILIMMYLPSQHFNENVYIIFNQLLMDLH